MDKLRMCRICLVENVRMYVVVNKNLQELYEKLTDVPFVTEDSRPMFACFVCCTLLKKCYRLQKKCQEAEEWFTQIMNEDYKDMNIVEAGQTESNVVKEELPSICEGQDLSIKSKEEPQSDDVVETKNLFDNYLDIEYKPPYHSVPDLEDHVRLVEFKTETDEEQEVSENIRKTQKINRSSVAEKPVQDKRRIKLQDVITAELKNEQTSNLTVRQKTQIRTTELDTYFNEASECIQLSLNGEMKSETQTLICEKLYKCDVCQYSFSKKNSLITHKRTHTGEKPYKCNICQRSFCRNAGLTRHLRTHSGEKPFKCDYCLRHFSFKESLARHIFIHAGEKPYKCGVCQHGFTQMYHLKRHTAIHTNKIQSKVQRHFGEKPFKCNECRRTCGHLRVV